jgi:hypothetical protein
MIKQTFLVLAALGLAACADRDPVVEQQSEKRYQGKLDTKPWGNGDRASWETQLKARQLMQDEYRRIAR